MSFIDENVIFCLMGNEFRDSSSNATPITINGMNGNQIIESENEGKKVKAIDFNTTGYLTFNLNGSFLQNEYTIDWWEFDNGNATATSSLFTNITTSTGNYYFALASTKSGDALRNIIGISSKPSASYDILSNFSIGTEIKNEWVHRAVVFDKKNGMYRFFENGKLFVEVAKTAVPQKCDTFQMNRFRATNAALQKKIYNFRVSNSVRYIEEFIPDATQYIPSNDTGNDNDHECPIIPPIDNEIIKADIEDVIVEEITDTTLSSVVDKIIDIKDANNKLKNNLVKVLNVKGIDATTDEKMNDLIKKVNENL